MNAWSMLVERLGVDASFSGRLCLTLLHSLWQFAALAGVVWLMDRLLQRLSVEWRYNLHVAALVLGLAAVATTWSVLEPASFSPPDARRAQTSEVEFVSIAERDQRSATIPFANLAGTDRQAPPASASATVPAAAEPHPMAQRITRWVVVLYALGVLLMLGRLLRGVWRSQRLLAQAEPLISAPLATSLRSLAERWRLHAVPRLAISQRLAMPCVTGLVRPTIVFPLAAVSGLSAAELEMILAHELAHVRRHDLWVHFLQRLAESVLFFNPGLWYLSHRVSALREFCCDELACGRAAGASIQTRIRYAGALVHLVEMQCFESTTSHLLAQADIAALAADGGSPSQLRRRVAALLDEPMRDPLRLSRGNAVAVTALAIALIATPVIGFSHPSSVSTSLAKSGEPDAVSQVVKPPDKKAEPSDVPAVKVLAIGRSDALKTGEPQWWNMEGDPCAAPSPNRIGGNRNTDLMKPPNCRQVVFELPGLTRTSAVRYEISSGQMIARNVAIDRVPRSTADRTEGARRGTGSGQDADTARRHCERRMDHGLPRRHVRSSTG